MQCPRQLDTFNFKELKFDPALLAMRRNTPRKRSTQPRISSRALGSPFDCITRQTPLFPTRWSRIPWGHGLVLRFLRATA